MGSFISDDHPVLKAAVTIGEDGKPLQGWWSDPTKRHEERYFSQGVPTKLYRDGYAKGNTVEGYDDVSADSISGTENGDEPSPGIEDSEQRGGESADALSPEERTLVRTPPAPITDLAGAKTGVEAPEDGEGATLCPRCGAELRAAGIDRSIGCLKLHWNPVDRAAGSITVDMDVQDDLRGPDGSLEDWVVPVLAEVAGESAIGGVIGPVVTQHLGLSCLCPGSVGPLRAIIVPLHIGRRDGIAEVKVVDTGDNDRLIAIGTVTARRAEEGRTSGPSPGRWKTASTAPS